MTHLFLWKKSPSPSTQTIDRSFQGPKSPFSQEDTAQTQTIYNISDDTHHIQFF